MLAFLQFLLSSPCAFVGGLILLAVICHYVVKLVLGLASVVAMRGLTRALQPTKRNAP